MGDNGSCRVSQYPGQEVFMCSFDGKGMKATELTSYNGAQCTATEPTVVELNAGDPKLTQAYTSYQCGDAQADLRVLTKKGKVQNVTVNVNDQSSPNVSANLTESGTLTIGQLTGGHINEK